MAQGHEMAFFCYQYRAEARKEQGTNVVVKVYDMIIDQGYSSTLGHYN